AEVALVPPGVVTVTSTVPAVPAGETAVILVAETTVTLLAPVKPKSTVAPVTNPVPVTVTVVPPATGPAAGEILVTAGTGSYVNWSDAEVALVPPGVVTVTSTVPAEPAGETAVMLVADTTVTLLAPVKPKSTVAPVTNPVPVIVTVVPPANGPAAGEMPVTVGTGSYVNWSDAEVALVPPGVVTVTSTVPVPAGETAVILVPDTTVTLLAPVKPKSTVAPVTNPVPVTVTVVPPATGPAAGEMPVTAGTGSYVNWSDAEVALIPPGVVTVTSTVPAEPAGETAVILVPDTTVTLLAPVKPKSTVAPVTNPVPVTVTVVPPATGPAAGEMPVTAGTGSYVNSSAGNVALVPPGVVTVTSTVPAEPAGETAVMLVADTTVTLLAPVKPKSTVAPVTNPVPVIVTV